MLPFLLFLAVHAASLGAAAPNLPRDIPIAISDPAASDPANPPSSFKALWRPDGQNPFSGNIPLLASACRNPWEKPSRECADAAIAQSGLVAFGGGTIKYEDGSCNPYKNIIETAAWDAVTLARFAKAVPTTGRQIPTWRTYIGPDFAEYQDRISQNFQRAEEFKGKKSFDIILSCKDTKDQCKTRIDGKAAGGWFGWKYQHVTLCPVFFELRTLDDTFELLEDGLERGELKYAQEAEWQANTGQYLLHEIMHLDAVGIPKIDDQRVEEGGRGPRAYGPYYVDRLAQRPLNQKGGGQRSSLNADNYAWLPNSLYFYDSINYFPKPPQYGKWGSEIGTLGSGEHQRMQNGFPVDLGYMDFNVSSWTQAEIEARAAPTFEGMKNPLLATIAPLVEPIPDPECSFEGPAFSQPEAEEHINNFYSNSAYWENVIVSPLPNGTAETSDGNPKSSGTSYPYKITGSGDRLWLGLMYSRESCTGTFRFTLGKTDEEKRDYCRARFRTILNGCQTDMTTAKKGGILNAGCGTYGVIASKDDPFSMEKWYGDLGTLVCEDTLAVDESPLRGTCTCWYSNYPGLTEVYKMPPSKQCKSGDVNLKELFNN
ncbi:hypothetical protein GCG54_00010444 [Colletotrichum gloeosporioides]|uniref:Lysine-specific metallo-endopeptidase domain-containing protein n=1 Tax=Colletotrichum gloeosporioides TaxID=474922 RepID=A0A8H4CVX9_COLGL|nr:uncharacterized protein GCG54_00010444 [Colletotrichum gloeosporioides]KAF3811108.1 hypothetical protein GCG54_00010444 [Colletotrichum gloeosporioides]